MHIQLPVLIVGHGQMGAAILRGLLRRNIKRSDVAVVEILKPVRGALARRRIAAVDHVKQLPDDFRPGTVLIALKPQQIPAVLPDYREYVRGNTVLLTVAAGIRVEAYERILGESAAIVRAMPNTPAAICRGTSVLFGNRSATTSQRASCEALMGHVGDVSWIDDETLMDAITAVSGGGPAYVFLLMEYLASAAINAGLPGDLAMKLVQSTVAGAAELARSSGEPVAQLRKNVTSPNGTTAAALRVLMRQPGGLEDMLREAIIAARDRGVELGR
jgi:pyrroline-5-carboxylate reductase